MLASIVKTGKLPALPRPVRRDHKAAANTLRMTKGMFLRLGQRPRGLGHQEAKMTTESLNLLIYRIIAVYKTK